MSWSPSDHGIPNTQETRALLERLDALGELTQCAHELFAPQGFSQSDWSQSLSPPKPSYSETEDSSPTESMKCRPPDDMHDSDYPPCVADDDPDLSLLLPDLPQGLPDCDAPNEAQEQTEMAAHDLMFRQGNLRHPNPCR